MDNFQRNNRKQARKEKRKKFVKLQFSEVITPKQKFFDVVFGIAAPILCLIFDPVVFKGSLFDGGILSRYRVFAFCLIGLEILVLALWLFVPNRSRVLSAILTGILCAGGLLSLLLGLLILPVALLALFFLQVVGIFGLIPIVTAFVFARNSIRALRTISMKIPKIGFAAWMLAGAILVFAGPIFLQWQTSRIVDQSVETISHGSPEERELAVDQLKKAFWCSKDTCFDALVWDYFEYHQKSMEAFWIADAYLELTGEPIQARLNTIYSE